MRKIGYLNATAPWALALGLLAMFRLAATGLAETPAAPPEAPAVAAAAPATTPAAEPPAAPAATAAPETSPGAALAAPPPPPAPKFQPVSFWPGTIIQARVTSESQPWLDLDTLLRKGRITAADEEDIPTTQRPPPDGKQYAILVVKLQEKRSIGKYDFTLSTGAETIPCLAMSQDDKPYDQRLWEVKFDSGAVEVNLLYEVPADTTDVNLMHALPVTLPQPDAPLHFMTDTASVDAPAEDIPADAVPTSTSSPEAAPAAPDAAAPAAGTAK